MTLSVLGAMSWVDAGVAFGAGLVATVAWTLAALGFRWARLWSHLHSFAGDYDIYPKFAETTDGIAEVRVKKNVLRVGFREQRVEGLVDGRIFMNERFPQTGHGAYTHRFLSGKLGWGIWDVELYDDGGKTILVTTRYPLAGQPVEIVQGYEWRRRSRSASDSGEATRSRDSRFPNSDSAPRRRHVN